MLSWFNRKKTSPEEVSEGGSVIKRYSADSLACGKLGFADNAAEFARRREEVYRKMFEEPEKVWHEVLPQIPHIDVFTYRLARADGSAVFALVTSGMSDLPMTLPKGAAAPRRAELIFYCQEPKQEYLDTMRWLAHFVHNQRSWFGFGHTIPNGDPPEPLWGSSVLDTLLLMPTIVKSHASISDELILDGDAVAFLWIVPLTTAECNLKLARGFDAILDLFQQRRHPWVFDPARQSYV